MQVWTLWEANARRAPTPPAPHSSSASRGLLPRGFLTRCYKDFNNPNRKRSAPESMQRDWGWVNTSDLGDAEEVLGGGGGMGKEGFCFYFSRRSLLFPGPSV